MTEKPAALPSLPHCPDCGMVLTRRSVNMVCGLWCMGCNGYKVPLIKALPSSPAPTKVSIDWHTLEAAFSTCLKSGAYQKPRYICGFCEEGAEYSSEIKHDFCGNDPCPVGIIAKLLWPGESVPSTPSPMKISESDMRGVFGHKCDQEACPVCGNPKKSADYLAGRREALEDCWARLPAMIRALEALVFKEPDRTATVCEWCHGRPCTCPKPTSCPSKKVENNS